MAPKSPKLPRLKLSFSSAEFLTPSTAIPITPTTAEPSMPIAPATPTTATESSPVITPPTITTDVPESTELDFAPVSATVADSILVTAISTLQFPHTPSSPTKASPLQISTSFNATHTVDLNGLFNDPKLAASLLPPPAQVLLSPITLKAPEPLSAIIEHSSKSTSNPKPKIRFGELTVGKFFSHFVLRNLCKKAWYNDLVAHGKVPTEMAFKEYFGQISLADRKAWDVKAKSTNRNLSEDAGCSQVLSLTTATSNTA
ncbi:hypothetical protein F5050DRAFT_1715710 [Lentinula boryana]|uniref:Uncharacterized protein n=1 Tax=Lentinula boryana TaxID=40481 RepID=A0ABQ8Q067_9AGAR|nr:hypothetical protein F5050DRAFT_1715710 [Lentinula boryana]